MAREMEHPTEALDQVMTQVVKPRLEYLSGVAGTVMGLPPSDPRVKRCIASLQMQCLMARAADPAAARKDVRPGDARRRRRRRSHRRVLARRNEGDRRWKMNLPILRFA